MQHKNKTDRLSNWRSELDLSIFESDSFYVALYELDGTLIYANQAMVYLFKNNPKDSLINPSFEELITLDYATKLVFEGFLTIGDYSSINMSINAKIYRKDTEILVTGGVDTHHLIMQNESVHLLNREIGNLQRKLIQEKQLLENTLKELNNANTQLEALNATKNKFFSIIAHDLRNPFTSLIGFSDLLVTNAPDYSIQKIQKFALNIHNVSKNTFELLENLLTWSRLQTANITPQIVDVELHEVINDVFNLCHPIAVSKKINLILQLDTAVNLKADRQMLQTVLRNLITNSLKFTHEDGIVTISTQNKENETLIIVSDTGIGIKREYLDKLFSIDCELSMDGTAKEKGTGLGLILCKEFVEKQNGIIWVESELGKGSSFKFTIPK
ncbi:MAG: HAMP domain-containing histidine kinase [Flavobacteriaceae bacterium]|nr:HAMP domain-containing histidine kinase [Flavobacteriaceae bacterium]